MSLQLLQTVLEDLRLGVPLSCDCRQWLSDGFETFLLHGGDLAEHLALRIKVPPGGRFYQPAEIERRARRNSLLQELAGLQSGRNTWQRASQVAMLIDRYPGGRATEEERSLLEQLAHCGVELPRSAKQIQRVIQNETVPGRLGHHR